MLGLSESLLNGRPGSGSSLVLTVFRPRRPHILTSSVEASLPSIDGT